jgi:8-oxo-dGTP pyrophosphatase MutT (NUDIX family)
MIPDNDFYCADGAFFVLFRRTSKDLEPDILFVERVDNHRLDLPGGGVEYSSESNDDAFRDCVIREVFEETGFIPIYKRIAHDAVLRQRVLKPVRMIGSVHLFQYILSKNEVIDEVFVGDETAKIEFINFQDIDFTQTSSISLAARRMVIISMRRYIAAINGGGSQLIRPFIGCLGKPVRLDEDHPWV